MSTLGNVPPLWFVPRVKTKDDYIREFKRDYEKAKRAKPVYNTALQAQLSKPYKK